MKVTFLFENKEYTISIFYVWDKEDKYLIVNDDTEKVKYVPNTFKGDFDEYDVRKLISDFATKILKLSDYQWRERGKVTKCCHNDEYCSYYKKKYKYVGCDECPINY